MALVPHWRRVLWRASSLWTVYISGFLEWAIQVLPYVADWLPWWVPLAILALTPIARIIEQRSIHAREPDRQD
jgi:hypothetical protein